MIVLPEQDLQKRRQEFILNEDDILNLHNGIVLFEAPGDMQMLYPYNIIIKTIFNGIPYVCVGVLQFSFEGKENVPFFQSSNEAITFAEDTLFSISKMNDDRLRENSAFSVKLSSPAIGGNGIIEIYVEFDRVIV